MTNFPDAGPCVCGCPAAEYDGHVCEEMPLILAARVAAMRALQAQDEWDGVVDIIPIVAAVLSVAQEVDDD